MPQTPPSSPPGGSGSPAEPLIPPLRQLSLLPPAEQEAALVDDLLSVFMGQAGQYIRHEMLEGPKWQRLGLKVVGLSDASLLEQVRGCGGSACRHAGTCGTVYLRYVMRACLPACVCAAG